MQLLKFFDCCKIDDQNFFSITNLNRGSPSVNKDFPMSINGHDECVKRNVDMMSNIKWTHHINFDNPDLGHEIEN